MNRRGRRRAFVGSLLTGWRRSGRRHRVTRRLCGAGIASLAGSCGVSAGADHLTPSSTRTVHAVAASCAALTDNQKFASAHVVVDGTMLLGPTVPLGRARVLSSPARVRMIRYLKGNGPSIVQVETAAAPTAAGVAYNEDGIQPTAGQQWRIYADRSRQPLTTSICAGSRRLGARKASVRRFIGDGLSFRYPSVRRHRDPREG